MCDKQIDNLGHNEGESAQRIAKKKHGSRKDKLSLSECLKDHPVLFIAGTILVLVIIACSIWLALRALQSYLRANGITTFSMDAGLANWFSLCISYAGAVATVVLGILTVRLTLKQDQNNDLATISALQLNEFRICDLWHEYTPTRFERDRGRRFVLSFDITGLRTYYNIRRIELSWMPDGNGSARHIMLANQEVLHQRTDVAKVTAYFDEFPGCSPSDSMYYFLRLNLYEPGMMSPEEKRRWLRTHIILDYADGKTASDVYCDYLLEYDGTVAGTTELKPVDHRAKVSSTRKR